MIHILGAQASCLHHQQVLEMFLHFVRDGEAPAEPLTVNGSPGGSPSHTLTKASKDFLKLAYESSAKNH